jgi:hypothetical protein
VQPFFFFCLDSAEFWDQRRSFRGFSDFDPDRQCVKITQMREKSPHQPSFLLRTERALRDFGANAKK